MKKLNEKEAVHCRTQEEFDSVIKELNKQGIYWGVDYPTNGSHCFKKYKNIVLLVMYKSIYFGSVEFSQEHGYKILTYSELMGEAWTPKAGCRYWSIYTDPFPSDQQINLTIDAVFYCDDNFDKRNIQSNNYFRTRQLAREAKKAIEETLKKARKG